MAEEQKKKRSGWYQFARIAAGVVMRILIPVHYHGLENVAEREGAFIIIGNHSSMLDPVAVAWPIKKREITFMGKKELTKNKLLDRILRNMHMIVVDRHHTDMQAMRAAVGVLRQGEILGIFPEGTRHHEGLMTELETGAAMIAMRSGVPLIPVLITPKLRLFHRTEIYVGAPIDFSDLRAEGVNNDTCARLLERISARYAAWMQEIAG